MTVTAGKYGMMYRVATTFPSATHCIDLRIYEESMNNDNIENTLSIYALKEKETKEAIGGFWIAYSQLEFTIKAKLSGLFAEHEDFMVAIESISAQQALDALIIIGKRRDILKDDREKEFRKFKRDLDELIRSRNKFAHGLWAGNIEGGYTLAKGWGKQNVGRSHHFEDIEEIRKLSTICQMMMQRIMLI